mmetsp:Transcript_28941/g.41278  ORF Transcript_28941/g.41278 Transcript_28941/m.41278 type:complete len:329 (-) Transcript_28941:361-1347(-)
MIMNATSLQSSSRKLLIKYNNHPPYRTDSVMQDPAMQSKWHLRVCLQLVLVLLRRLHLVHHSVVSVQVHSAAEPYVEGGAVGGGGEPGGHSVAIAEAAVAEERPAFLHLLSARGRTRGVPLHFLGGLVGTVCQELFQRLALYIVPVLHPLPGVADHVVQAVVVLRRERVHRGQELVAVLRGVAGGELALEDVHAVLAWRLEHLVAPRKQLVARHRSSVSVGTPGSTFPFGFGGQSTSSPLTELHCVRPRHLDNGIITPIRLKHIGVRSFRFSPIRTIDRQPPFCTKHCLRYFRFYFLGYSGFENKRPAEGLAICPVPSFIDKFLKVII